MSVIYTKFLMNRYKEYLSKKYSLQISEKEISEHLNSLSLLFLSFSDLKIKKDSESLHRFSVDDSEIIN